MRAVIGYIEEERILLMVINKLQGGLRLDVQPVIHIDVDPEQIIKRLARRAREENRVDDAEQTVRNRMRVYAEQTAPVADYYAERGMLTRVLGDGPKEEVVQRILSVLNVHNTSD